MVFLEMPAHFFLMQQFLLVKISLTELKQCNFVDDHHHKHIL